MNTDLRNVLIAKTILEEGKVSKYELTKAAAREAITELRNSPNNGYRNTIVIQARAEKIFKNLLKQYTTSFIKKRFIKRNHFRFNSSDNIKKLSKTQLITVVTMLSSGLIKMHIRKILHENTHS